MLKFFIFSIVTVIFTNFSFAATDVCTAAMSLKKFERIVKDSESNLSKAQQDSLFLFFEKTQKNGVATVSDPELARLLEQITGRSWRVVEKSQMQNILFLAFKRIPLSISRTRSAHAARANKDDIQQEANLALLKAMHNYPLGSLTSFSAYAAKYIDWSLMNFEHEQETGETL